MKKIPEGYVGIDGADFQLCTGWVVVVKSQGLNYVWYDRDTFKSTRREAIDRYTDDSRCNDEWHSLYMDRLYGSAARMWRSERRAGHVKCVKVELIPRPVAVEYDFDSKSDECAILLDVERRIRDYLRRSEGRENACENINEAFRQMGEAIGKAFGFDPVEEIIEDCSGGGG